MSATPGSTRGSTDDPGQTGGFPIAATPRHGSRSRFSISDAVAIAACLIAMVGGYWLIRAHDARQTVTEIDGVAISRPAGWLQAPAVAPAIASWADSSGRGASLAVYRAQTSSGLDSGALAIGLNPAASSPGFTPLGSRSLEVSGGTGTQTDYAYVRQYIGRGLPPSVMRGRQVAWIQDGALVTVALEAPEGTWDDVLRSAGRSLPGGGR